LLLVSSIAADFSNFTDGISDKIAYAFHRDIGQLSVRVSSCGQDKRKTATMQWQREQVLALAPDQASVKAAQSLTTVNTWPVLGRSEVALWGECQGSGKTPYKTAIDLREPAFKCSCPSRKFPCKHALALFLLALQSAGTQADDAFVETTESPEWVASWLAERTKREEARQAKVATEPATATSTAAARPAAAQAAAERRAVERAAKVAAGVEELTMWLKDLVRSGYVDAQARPHSEWEQMAARLIDAQAPALATQVQSLRSIILSGKDWAERFTAAIGRLFLLLEAYQRIAELPPALQQDVRTLIGWYPNKEEVLARPAVFGQWGVLSNTLTQEENLLSQRVWLQETSTGIYALILNFAHPSNRQALDTHWRVGTVIPATLHYYDSTIPLRALTSPINTVAPLAIPAVGDAIADALQRYQRALAHNPWLTHYPMTLANAVVGLGHRPSSNQQETHAYVYDTECHQLPLSRSTKTHWKLLSISGGKPASIFGEWWNDGFYPLGLWHEGHYWAL